MLKQQQANQLVSELLNWPRDARLQLREGLGFCCFGFCCLFMICGSCVGRRNRRKSEGRRIRVVVLDLSSNSYFCVGVGLISTASLISRCSLTILSNQKHKKNKKHSRVINHVLSCRKLLKSSYIIPSKSINNQLEHLRVYPIQSFSISPTTSIIK